MAQLTEKRRPSLGELQSSPEIVWRLEVAQIIEDAQGQPVAQEAEALLTTPDAITPELIIELREKIHG